MENQQRRAVERKGIDMNLHEKMLEVMKAIEYLNKDDAVKYGQTSYRAMSEEKVTSTVRKEFVRLGIVVLPIEQTVSKDGNITTTNTKYKMVNVEDPMDYEILASSGQGADTQDKGVGKAMTYSFKYMLLRAFAIPTGEDPDKISSDQLDDDEDIARIKKMLEETDTDTEKFLKAMSSKFKREVKSVDDMRGRVYGKDKTRELAYALMRLNDKKKGDN